MNRNVKTFICLLAVLACLCALAACAPAKPAATGKTHDPLTLEQTDKPGTFFPHSFKDGKCKFCDETTIFTQDTICGTDVITKACDQQGTIESITYQDTTGENVIERTAWVYLPYGYDKNDANTKYDVLYMLHGSGLNEGYWFAKGDYSPEMNNYVNSYGTENVLDNLMKEGKAKKTICVSPTFNGSGNSTKELTEILMPLIAKTYHTYADVAPDATAEEAAAALKANRYHQGFVGLSAGSGFTFSVVWKNCLEYFAYIGSFSGSSGSNSWQEMIDAKNTTYKDCDIKYWYITLGTVEKGNTESGRGDYPGDPFNAYRAFVSGMNGMQPGSDIKNGDNCEFMWCNNQGHNYKTWITALYNCMQVFFQA